MTQYQPLGQQSHVHSRQLIQLNRDPIGYENGPYLYEYVGGNPIMFSDRHGTTPDNDGLGVAGVSRVPCNPQGDGRLHISIQIGETVRGDRTVIWLALTIIRQN